MKYLAILSLVLAASFSVTAQTTPADKRFPMTLDSFYMQVRFVDGSKSDYEVHKTSEGWRSTERRFFTVFDLKNDSLGDKGLMRDSLVISEVDFSDVQTMLMSIMHAKGLKAKSYLITPMLPIDIDDKLINRH
jgi:hypothetical protein